MYIIQMVMAYNCTQFKWSWRTTVHNSSGLSKNVQNSKGHGAYSCTLFKWSGQRTSVHNSNYQVIERTTVHKLNGQVSVQTKIAYNAMEALKVVKWPWKLK